MFNVGNYLVDYMPATFCFPSRAVCATPQLFLLRHTLYLRSSINGGNPRDPVRSKQLPNRCILVKPLWVIEDPRFDNGVIRRPFGDSEKRGTAVTTEVWSDMWAGISGFRNGFGRSWWVLVWSWESRAGFVWMGKKGGWRDGWIVVENGLIRTLFNLDAFFWYDKVYGEYWSTGFAAI